MQLSKFLMTALALGATALPNPEAQSEGDLSARDAMPEPADSQDFNVRNPEDEGLLSRDDDNEFEVRTPKHHKHKGHHKDDKKHKDHKDHKDHGKRKHKGCGKGYHKVDNKCVKKCKKGSKLIDEKCVCDNGHTYSDKHGCKK